MKIYKKLKVIRMEITKNCFLCKKIFISNSPATIDYHSLVARGDTNRCDTCIANNKLYRQKKKDSRACCCAKSQRGAKCKFEVVTIDDITKYNLINTRLNGFNLFCKIHIDTYLSIMDETNSVYTIDDIDTFVQCKGCKKYLALNCYHDGYNSCYRCLKRYKPVRDNPITSCDCYMCGKKSNEYHLNGIDRVNNKNGYMIGNILPSCGDCNF
jgi:hypothetical protein